jgi:hypothetical protein
MRREERTFLFSSLIDPVTQTAYRETHFKVLGSEPFTLLIGEKSAALAAAHALHGVDCSAYLTAHNPWSQALPEVENEQRQSDLKRHLASCGLSFAEGIGEHPSSGWPGEPSLLVFGLSLEAAKILARNWSQNAIVWSGPDAVPQLVLLR